MQYTLTHPVASQIIHAQHGLGYWKSIFIPRFQSILSYIVYDGTKYDTLKLCLWACTVAGDIHKDLENPPNTQTFGSTPKRHRESVSSAINGAANALTKALSGTPPNDNTNCQTGVTGVSPGRAIDLQMKNYQQLRYVQQLFDDGILTEKDYTEQKEVILESLRL